MPLTLTKREKSEFWYVRGTVAGIAVFETTKCTNRRDADAYRTALEHALLSDAANAHKKRFSDAAAVYKAKGGEVRWLDKIEREIGHLYLDDVTQFIIDTTAYRLFPHQAASTVKRQFYVPICAVLHYASEIDWVAYKKIKLPTVTRPAPKWAEPKWFEAFWPECSVQLRAITTFLPYTGCRISEVLSLAWENVNLATCEAYIPDTKNGTPRTVFLPPQVMEQLLLIKPDQPYGRVFNNWKDRTSVNWAIRRVVARVNKKRAELQLPPIEHLSTHKIGSHTYATWMRRYAKMDQRGLVGTGRWKSIQSTMIYTHTSSTDENKKAIYLPHIRAKSVHSTRKAVK